MSWTQEKIVTQRAKLEAERAELEEKLADLDDQEQYLNSLPPVKLLAQGMHELNCHSNHIDQCDWEYGSWDNPRGAQQRWLRSAEKVLDEMGDKYTVDEILDMGRILSGR